MANGEKGKGRSQNQRLKLFYLLDYLLEETDETHTKKVREIIEHAIILFPLVGLCGNKA